jgi:hypothetical protein
METPSCGYKGINRTTIMTSRETSRASIISANEVEPAHDLEAHLSTLRALDSVRKRSTALRKEGYWMLTAWMDSGEYTDAVLVDRLVAARVRWQLSSKTRGADRAPLGRIAHSVTLEKIADYTCPVLLASDAMRALASLPRLVLTQPVMFSWYWIVRELFSTAPPDWRIGGARAAKGGWVTAYSTFQCVAAIQEVAASLTATAHFFKEVARIEDRLGELNDDNIPHRWRELETVRLAESSAMTLTACARAAALDIHVPATAPAGRLVRFVQSRNRLQHRVHVALTVAHRNLARSLRAIDTFRKRENRRRGQARTQTTTGEFAYAEHGHLLARRALVDAIKRCERAAGAAKVRNWEAIASEFSIAAQRMRTVLEPNRSYLSSVIDRQLAASDTRDGRQWDLPELVFATLAYFHLGTADGADLDRSQRAIARVCEYLGADGTVPSGRPYHATADGSGLLVNNTSVLLAIAGLILHGHPALSEELTAKLLPYLEERKFGRLSSDKGLGGWYGEFDRTRRRTDLLETALAVEALSSIERALDEGINDMILDHFNVREAKDSPTLDHLFYPDYGLVRPNTRITVSEIYRPSIATTLQRIRAHVRRENAKEPLHSLVLHGPPGTGKTTLVEAVANTCGARLVEVTPSDLAKGGEVAIEQRARAVFYALSLLTGVVVLFDEFDPVLRDREMAGSGSLNILSFLTPGMLPKLKELSERAREQATAYILITNLIGTLDDAAVRQGRFDERVGIYPPDPLSRLGYFELLCARQSRAQGKQKLWSSGRCDRRRMAEFIVKTGGMGMTPLMSKGWYRLADSDLQRTPIGYVFGRTNSLDGFAFEPEASFKQRLRGDGPSARREYLQWGWLDAWEKAFGKPDWNSLSRVQANSLREIAYEWPCSRASKDSFDRMMSGLKKGDNRLLIALLGDEILLRWKHATDGLFAKITARLRDARTIPEIRTACSAPMLAAEDLFVFEHCATQALRAPLFEDDSVASQVVYVSVLVKDFIRSQAGLAALTEGTTNDGLLVSGWKELRTAADRIDGAVSKLFVHIDRQYRAYLDSTTFWKSELSPARANDVLQLAMQRRLGGTGPAQTWRRGRPLSVEVEGDDVDKGEIGHQRFR